MLRVIDYLFNPNDDDKIHLLLSIPDSLSYASIPFDRHIDLPKSIESLKKLTKLIKFDNNI